MYKIRLLAVICLLQCICNIGFSQVNVEWFRTYDWGFSLNLMNEFTMDSSGNSYLTGDATRNAGESVEAMATVKYNSNGDLQWARLFQGSQVRLDRGEAVAVDNVGNVYVAGSTQDTDSSENYCTVKYDSNGEIVWVRKYEAFPGSRDFATDIALDEDGSVYLTGYTIQSSTYCFNTIKYDSSGNLIWASRFDESLSTLKFTKSITVDNFKNVYVTGFFSNNTCIIKYDSNGLQQWVSYFDYLNLNDRPTDIRLDKHGNVFVLAKSFLGNYLDEYYTSFVKYDNSGNQIWAYATDSIGLFSDYYRTRMSFRIDSAGYIYFATGYRNSSSLIKLDSNGIELWNAKYNGRPTFLYVQGNAVDIDKEGFIYLTGSGTRSQGAEFCTLKYDSNGVLRWVRHFYSNSYTNAGDISAFVLTDNSLNVYVAGIVHGLSIDSRFCVVKYSQSVGINNITTEIPSDYNLYQNYPNPFNPQTILQYEIPVAGFVTLRVYDVLGKEIMALVNEVQNAGKYETEFGGSDLPGGVYYYRLTAGGFSQSKKMLLIK